MKFLIATLFLTLFAGVIICNNDLDESYLMNEFNKLESNLNDAQKLVKRINLQSVQEVQGKDEPNSSNVLRQFFKNISNEISNMRGLVHSMNDQILKAIRINRRNQNKSTNSTLNNRVKRDTIDAATRQTTAIANNLINSFSEGLQNSLAALNNLMININRSVNNILNRVSNQITNGVVAVNNAAQSGVATLNNAAQSGINVVGSLTQAGLNTVTGAAQVGLNAVGSVVQTGYNTVSNAASSTVNAASNTVNRITG